jgi:hypothetical protein
MSTKIAALYLIGPADVTPDTLSSFKVGYTTNLRARLSSLQSSRPDRIRVWAHFPTTYAGLEKVAHTRLKILFNGHGEHYTATLRELCTALDKLGVPLSY